jgi:hypothetical protein
MQPMPGRVAQDRVNVGCFWSLAIGWAILSWIWSFLPGGYSHSPLYDEIAVGSLFLGALYFSYDRWRFADATLIVDAPPVPGHAFRGKVETPLKSEPPAGIRARLRATYYVRRPGRTIVWSSTVDAHPTRGEHGLIVPVEMTVPGELANDPRSLDWDVTIQARVPFGLYRARFAVPPAAARTPP